MITQWLLLFLEQFKMEVLIYCWNCCHTCSQICIYCSEVVNICLALNCAHNSILCWSWITEDCDMSIWTLFHKSSFWNLVWSLNFLKIWKLLYLILIDMLCTQQLVLTNLLIFFFFLGFWKRNWLPFSFNVNWLRRAEWVWSTMTWNF